MGLLNNSLHGANKRHMSDWLVNGRECSKKHALSPPKCPQQVRSRFDARSVLLVHEHGKTATMSVRSHRTPLAAFFNIPNIGVREL